jgi:hypothetical protein
MTAFLEFFTRPYDTIVAEERYVREMGCEIRGLIRPQASAELTTRHKKRTSMCTRSRCKTQISGLDDLSLEFYITMWDTIKEDLLRVYNEMIIHRHMPAEQKMELIVCMPKIAHPTTPNDYRPISPLNSDYKIFARIIDNRVRRILPEVIHPRKHCGVSGRYILDEVGGIRDVIAYAEVTRTTLCILSILPLTTSPTTIC